MKKLTNKNVLFITTKNLDYLRNTQEIEELKAISQSVDIIGSHNRNYFVRIVYVYLKILLLNSKIYDAVFIGFAPQLILPFWNWKFKKKEIYIDFFISMYDTFVCDRKKFSEDSIVAKLFWKLDKMTLETANQIIADTKAHGEYFASEFYVESEKIQVLYLKADTSIYYPREVEKRDEILGKFDVLYFGSVLPLQGVEFVIEAARMLKDEEDIHFTIIGPIKDKLKKYESDNVEYIEWLSQKELAQYIAMSDLCLAGHFNATIGKANRTIPGKAYIYHAMNKKMILGDSKANHELFDDKDGVYFVEMGNSRALSQKIMGIKEFNE